MSLALVPFSDMQQMSAAIAKSGLFGMKTPDQALALMLVAQAEGQHPATITQDYDIIQGKATRKTHSVLARFQAAGGKLEWHMLTGMIADATFSHPQGGSLRMEWTIAQAKLAGLTGKDNWKNYPRAMLRARCIAEGVRAVYPAAIGGMLVAEEAQDMPALPTAPKNMGAAEQVPAQEPPQVLIDSATLSAQGGVARYSEFWQSIGKEQRHLLGAMHAGFKAQAEAADKARTIDSEYAEVPPVDDPFVRAMESAEQGAQS